MPYAVIMNDWDITAGNIGEKALPSHTNHEDFPGLFFIWDSESSLDVGYMKVDARVFDEYDSFMITLQVQDSYWDIWIPKPPDDQPMTDDKCYVFYFPVVYNNHISNVFPLFDSYNP